MCNIAALLLVYTKMATANLGCEWIAQRNDQMTAERRDRVWKYSIYNRYTPHHVWRDLGIEEDNWRSEARAIWNRYRCDREASFNLGELHMNVHRMLTPEDQCGSLSSWYWSDCFMPTQILLWRCHYHRWSILWSIVQVSPRVEICRNVATKCTTITSMRKKQDHWVLC